MKLNLLLFAGLLLVATLAMACGPQAPTTGSDGGPVTDDVGLVDALRAQGSDVEPRGDISQPFFTVEGRLIRVNGQDIQVFQYSDEAAADAEAQLVSPDGSSVGTSMISWVEPPHFFRADRMIVLYVGDDTATIELLETVLGPQFAGA